jgi:hypothetical protein
MSTFSKMKLTSWFQLYVNREIIALANRGDNGEVDTVWDFLFKTTRLLHCEGMSSDRSGQEGLGPPYYIRTREWRSRELISYLQLTDKDRRQTNAYGNSRSGNPAQE